MTLIAYINYQTDLVKGTRPPRFGDIRYLEVESNNQKFYILVKILDKRINKNLRCEVVPIAGDNTTFWVDATLLFEEVNPITVNREPNLKETK